MYTGNYPRRDACREEFFLFLEQSKKIGVQTLLIPVVWLGFESLLPEGEDEISDYVRAHQAANFREAWIEGVASAPFRKNALAIAARILDVTGTVEETLAKREIHEADQLSRPQVLLEGTARDSARASDPLESELDDDEVGLLDLNEQFNSDLNAMTDETKLLGQAMSDLGNIPQPPKEMTAPGAGTKYLIRVANYLKSPAQDLESHGTNLFHAARRADATLRSIVRLATASRSPQIISTLFNSLAPSLEKLPDLDPVDEQFDDLLEQMRGPEALSAAVRKATKPARKGVTAARDALALVSDWVPLVHSLQQQPIGTNELDRLHADDPEI